MNINFLTIFRDQILLGPLEEAGILEDQPWTRNLSTIGTCFR